MKARYGWLMPLGGYKGSGLGMLVEILCGVLGGGVMSTGVGGLHILDRLMSTAVLPRSRRRPFPAGRNSGAHQY
jgi:hypothetical protein